MSRRAIHQAALLYLPGKCITFDIGTLCLVEFTVCLSDHTERRVRVAHAILITNASGKVQSFVRIDFRAVLCPSVPHLGSSEAIEYCYASCERRSLLSPLSRSQVERQHAFHPSLCLAHLPSHMPETREACQSQSQFRLVLLLSPFQSSTGVGQFQRQCKVRLARSLLCPKVCHDSFCQPRVIGSVPPTIQVFLSCCAQPSQGVLSNHLKHSKAFPGPCRYLYLDEAGVYESCEDEYERFWHRVLSIPADLFNRFKRPASYEDAERAKI